MLHKPPGRASSVTFLRIWHWAFVLVVVGGKGSKSSHVVYNRSSIANPFGDDEPACDLQVYSFASWHADHSDELPDHPAIFEPDPETSFPALQMFPTFESVLQNMGQGIVNSEPGYAQAGGHLEIVWPGSKVRFGIVEANAGSWHFKTYFVDILSMITSFFLLLRLDGKARLQSLLQLGTPPIEAGITPNSTADQAYAVK